MRKFPEKAQFIKTSIEKEMEATHTDSMKEAESAMKSPYNKVFPRPGHFEG